MSDQLKSKILDHLKSESYRPQRPRGLAKELNLEQDEHYPAFREALRDLMHQGRIVIASRGAIVLPAQKSGRDEFTGTYRHNKRGFGFVIMSDGSHEDLYIPPGENGGAINGDIVRAKITSRGQRDGKAIYTGRVTEVIERKQSRFVGTLNKQGTTWMVLPDGNQFTDAILTPDAASRHIKVGTKVVVELTQYPEGEERAQGVITEVLGVAGEKDVDLKSVIIQHNLPAEFPEEVHAQARRAIDTFDPDTERNRRLDMTGDIICTIDPDDAKDYDDAISLTRTDDGMWELGVHIADVSFFVKDGTPLDEEAKKRGNSTYFPGHVIPMLPEILSNGVCSLQEAVPRLCKSAFITIGDDARPVRTRFANTIIKSRKRLRYKEAQAIIDGEQAIPHPDGAKALADYPAEVVQLLHDMNALSKRIQKRRKDDGQIVLDLPQVELVLDEEGKVIDAVPEDQSFTHTLIEMFMVEANEAVARLFASLDVPFIRRTHPGPEMEDSERLRTFVQVAGHRVPKQLDHKAIQALLESVKGKPESFAINLAVLKSLSRATYSPEPIGHYALASDNYAHFTSPIRRYADLTVHRLLDKYFEARGDATGKPGKARGGRKPKTLPDIPTYEELVEIGKHISFTERRSDDAERELRQVKVLTLMQGKIGEVFTGIVTGITNFGIFIQLQTYLVDGLIRYEDLMDDWWDVDTKAGFVRGQRTGVRIGIGDVTKVFVTKVDLPRRELGLAIHEILTRGKGKTPQHQDGQSADGGGGKSKKGGHRKGGGKSAAPIGGGSRHQRGPGGGGGGGGRGRRGGGGGGRGRRR
ncbi:MAG: ribonuclease [Phycisphaerales bacterium]|jgi:ribonuclease R|nr:ribonuclease [Phycisphaerales bacterium]